MYILSGDWGKKMISKIKKARNDSRIRDIVILTVLLAICIYGLANDFRFLWAVSAILFGIYAIMFVINDLLSRYRLIQRRNLIEARNAYLVSIGLEPIEDDTGRR